MDIKLKNNHKKRVMTAFFLLVLLTVATMLFFPVINQRAQEYLKEYDSREYTEAELGNWVSELYNGCYVLYLETQQDMTGKNACEIFLENYTAASEENERAVQEILNDTLESMKANFEDFRSVFDYCILQEGEIFRKNTSQPLEEALSDTKDTGLFEYYSDCFFIDFDQYGNAAMKALHTSRADIDMLVKKFDRVFREDILRERMSEYYSFEDHVTWKRPEGFQLIIGIPNTEAAMNYMGWNADYYMDGKYTYWQLYNSYYSAGAFLLYFVMLVLIIILVFAMTSRKIWKTEISMNRPKGCYLFEAAVIGIMFILVASEGFIEMIWGANAYQSYSQMYHIFMGEGMADMLVTAMVIFLIYASWYLCIRFIRPLFSLGLREYLRQYCLCYQIFPWIRGQWRKMKEEIEHIDFGNQGIRIILKVILLNFAVTSLGACMWFFGILPLALYSVVVFCLCKYHYDKIKSDYDILLNGMRKIAAGDLNIEIQSDLGHFEPLKKELFAIRYGLKNAVEKEVKSERMKTELITNVSHDLKTPLTAITTYVELLKKEGLTAEERDSYIEILENKSLRLKVLIEDLFEISKAASKNITLNLVEVDVVNLLKQVSVEHAAGFEESGLILRWEVPGEKLILRLDSAKTYRIFENLFINICKYAMPKSRVYVSVSKDEKWVTICIKNISSEEIGVNPEELTERFVRGDASRNTEGSGLGLAIAKSFTEAQGGDFAVETDGDLFKVVIRFQTYKRKIC